MAIYIEFDWLAVPNWNSPLFENTFSVIVSFVVFSLLGFQNFTFISNELTMSLTTRRIFFHDVFNMVAYEVARELNFTVFDWQSKHLFANNLNGIELITSDFECISFEFWYSIEYQVFLCRNVHQFRKLNFTSFAIAVLFSVVWIFFMAFVLFNVVPATIAASAQFFLIFRRLLHFLRFFCIFSYFFLLKFFLRLEIFKNLKIV